MPGYDEGRWAVATAAYWTRSGLRSRGWSTSLMRQFLGEPDRTIANPHDPHGGDPASLYLRSRVLEAEKTPEFRDKIAQRGRKNSQV